MERIVRAVLERDFASQAARPRGIFLRCLLAIIVVAPILVLVMDATVDDFQRPDSLARDAFQGSVALLLAAVGILTPPIAVGAILVERIQDTLPLVLASPIGPKRLALAKLLARSGVVLMWTLTAFPVFALLTLLGGVSGGQILNLAIVLVACILELSAWALWVSTTTSRYATATVAAYLLPAARWAGTLLLTWFLVEQAGTGQWNSLQVEAAICTTPFPGIVMIFEPTVLAGAAGTKLISSATWIYLGSSLVIATLSVFVAGGRLAREAEPRGAKLGRISRFLRRGRRTPGRTNPVLWKESNLINTAGSRPLYYLVLVAFLLITITVLAIDEWSDDDTIYGVFAGMVTATALVAGINAASSIGHERTQGSLDLVRCSPLSAEEIVRGKFGGILRGLSLLFLFPAGLLCLRFLVGSSWAPLLGFVSMAAVVGAWTAIGFRIGIATLETRRGVIRFAAVLGILAIALPLLCALLLEGFNIRGDAQDVVAGLLLGPCPPVAAGLGPFTLDEFERLDGWYRRDNDPIYWGVAWIVIHLWFAIREWFLLPERLARRLDEERNA